EHRALKPDIEKPSVLAQLGVFQCLARDLDSNGLFDNEIMLISKIYIPAIIPDKARILCKLFRYSMSRTADECCQRKF
ncbi:MAG: hypothetical protein K0R45_2050, partial [Pseudomonas sp.]|nr:hypothetical protein [Pseudomonas sp.]